MKVLSRSKTGLKQDVWMQHTLDYLLLSASGVFQVCKFWGDHRKMPLWNCCSAVFCKGLDHCSLWCRASVIVFDVKQEFVYLFFQHLLDLTSYVCIAGLTSYSRMAEAGSRFSGYFRQGLLRV